MPIEHNIAIAQLNSTVGDLEGNAQKVIRASRQAEALGADIVIFPEQFVTGYPAQDILLDADFINDTAYVNNEIAKRVGNITAIVGSIERTTAVDGKNLHNVALVMHNGRIIGRQAKTLLPNYDVFHELRYFVPAERVTPIEIDGTRYGITICEDMWDHNYQRKVIKDLADKHAEALINISASPYYIHKSVVRHRILQAHAQEHRLPFIYANMVGGQDELIFDGDSMVVNENGELVDRFPQGQECVRLIRQMPQTFVNTPWADEVFTMLTLGLRDYFNKNGLVKAVLGLSGGIDSALTCAVAVEALGKDNVLGLALPSEYSSDHSITDARALATNLGIDFKVIPIRQMYDATIASLKPHFGDKPFDVTEENIQARLRMLTLMAFTNKHGYTLLATGDKSESMLGYTTIYGDMSGGIAVIQDLTKTEAYEVSQAYNKRRGQIIPENTLTKPPSPELKPGQLAPFNYKQISPLAEHLVNHVPLASLRERGFSMEDIETTYAKFRAAEFKRWQAPIALKCKPISFGKGRMYPITNGYVPRALIENETLSLKNPFDATKNGKSKMCSL